MALPLYLAMTASEISAYDPFPTNFAYMACHFSPYSQGLSNLPASLPEKAMLILNDNFPCQSHCPGLVAQQLLETVEKFHCESLLLDFQRPHSPEIEQMVQAIQTALPCPLALPPAYAPNCDGPVFLPPCPLHIPLEEYLSCWSGREIWLEAALCQEDVRITSEGSVYIPHFPSDGLQGGFFDQTLCCNYRSEIEEDAICFTLFDTNESLCKKLDRAQALEVNRAVGLWQELSKKHHL